MVFADRNSSYTLLAEGFPDPILSGGRYSFSSFDLSRREPPLFQYWVFDGSTSEYFFNAPRLGGKQSDFGRYTVFEPANIGPTKKFLLFCALGVRTLAEDPPAVGRYEEGFFSGRIRTDEDTVWNTNSSTVIANLSQNGLSFRLDLRGRERGPANAGTEPTEFGSYRATTVTADDGTFIGTFTDDSGAEVGRISGAFFGPGGNEAGFALDLVTTVNDGPNVGQKLTVIGSGFVGR
ncbi:hypothetical protein ACFCW2_00085 [Qipengyuania sp. DSG2-2]|uniref:hypothetical protein n=1 Tax=Qipengyuania sp. DGS2-2 TaxID=3349631 RepID=UPI0036D3D20F